MSQRANLGGAFALLMIALPAALSAEAPHEYPATIEFLYVNANIGGSSGGHLALGVGDHVFHFQRYSDKTFRLVRDDRGRFEHMYRRLENRSMSVLPIRLSHTARTRLEDALTIRMRTHEKHIRNDRSLRIELDLIDRIMADEPIPLPATGFFQDEGSDFSARDAVIQRHGPGFFHARRHEIQEQLQSIDWSLPASPLPELPSDELFYPPTIEGPWTKWRRLQTESQAIEIIERGHALQPSALVDVDPRPLTPAERQAIQSLVASQREAMLALLVSRRPDRGAAMLVALARLQVLELSIRSNRLVLLDPVPDNHGIVSAETLAGIEGQSVLPTLAREARDLAYGRRASLTSNSTEMDLARLESDYGRYAQILEGLSGRPIRVFSGVQIPSRSRLHADLSSPTDAKGLERWRAFIKERKDLHTDRMRDLLSFHLIRENCVTKMMCAINEAFAGDTVEALGGQIEAGEGFSFIPFVAQGLVGERYRTGDLYVLRSERMLRLKKMRATDNDFVVGLRESNTISATAYEWRRRDSAFLFFTDDLFWLRPLLGIANASYATLYSIYGLAAAPFDEAERLQSGGRGIFYSGPELIFFNIRKGSYAHVATPDANNIEREPERAGP